MMGSMKYFPFPFGCGDSSVQKKCRQSVEYYNKLISPCINRITTCQERTSVLLLISVDIRWDSLTLAEDTCLLAGPLLCRL